MKSFEALKLLAVKDKTWRHVYSKKELGELFNETGVNLTSTIERLCRGGVLTRAAKGIYVYRLSQHAGSRTLDQIAEKMRPGKLLHVSLEAAAFQWGLISQGVFTRTYVTNGKAGRFETAFGTISFTHLDLTEKEIEEATISRSADKSAPIATKRRTFDDVVKTNRSIDLLREQFMKDEAGIDGAITYLDVEDDDTWDFLSADEERWLALPDAV